MINLILRVALASSAIIAPIAADAQHPRRPYGFDGHRQRHGEEARRYRQWRRGDRFDSRYARNYAPIDYRRYRGLRPPPRGYRYMRSGNDAVLVGVATGIVAAVIAGAVR